MRSASTLSNPKSYMTAYNKGATDAIAKVYRNPYDYQSDCENHSGYNDGHTDNMKPDSNGLILKNVRRCGICQSSADRYSNRFECSKNPCHMADLYTGIFSDLTHPFER